VRAKYRHIFFDVDSTLVTIEGISALAGDNAEIQKLTDDAMNGKVTVEEIYGRRLDIVRPSQSDIAALAELYLASVVDGAQETMAMLRAAGANLHLVTGGIAQAVAPLAEHLHIPSRAVHAVALEFHDDGSYKDFDRRSLLARSKGKELLVRALLARSKGGSAFIGDGVTDLEVKPVVDLFIGFGGVVQREIVRENAEVYVTAPTLKAVLPYLLES
jgi:phosphoserine phosphatase